MTQDARPTPPRSLRPPWLLFLAALGFLGCATLGVDQGQPLVPSKYETRTGPFTVFTNAPIAHDDPAVRSLRALERDITSGLGLRLPSDVDTVEVYVLRDRESFTHFLKFYYPELPPRRAFFLAQGTRRVVYTFHNDRLDEDLRHEGTHALLHAAVGDLPLWLDEGLAEYYEGPEGRQGLNPEHLGRLPDDLKTGWRPNLARLETLKTVREMTPLDYRESWAWVHYLLNGNGQEPGQSPGAGKAVLLAYLGDVRSGIKSAPLSERLTRADQGPDLRMLAHLDRLRNGPSQSTAPVVSTAKGLEPRVLFQDAPIESPQRPSPRRGFFGRLLSAFGGSTRSE